MKSCAIILAAGDGKRMKSSQPKVMCEVLFKPMLDWVLDAACESVSDICVITGRGSERIEAHLNGAYKTILQAERLGTGHAVQMAIPFIKEQNAAHVLVLCGDAPLMDARTVADAFKHHIKNQNDITAISARIKDPTGYGRIVRCEDGSFTGIVEEADADAGIRAINEVNAGAYWFRCRALLDALPRLTNDTGQREFYLTQTAELIRAVGGRCAAFTAASPDVVLGANNRAQLLELNECARWRILNRLMENGVSIPCADGILIGPDVVIGPDSVILPGTLLKGKTVIGRDCRIGPGVLARDARIGNSVRLHHVELQGCEIADSQTVKPFQVID